MQTKSENQLTSGGRVEAIRCRRFRTQHDGHSRGRGRKPGTGQQGAGQAAGNAARRAGRHDHDGVQSVGLAAAVRGSFWG